MGEVSRALALEGRLEYQGKTYRLAAMTWEVIGLWEDWLAERADRQLYRSKKWLPPDEYEYRLRVLAADKVGGRYDYFSAASLDAQNSWEGRIHFAALRLSEAEGSGLTLEEAARLAREMAETDLEKWEELRHKLDGMDADPNAPAPQKAGPNSTDSSPSAPASPGSPGA